MGVFITFDFLHDFIMELSEQQRIRFLVLIDKLSRFRAGETVIAEWTEAENAVINRLSTFRSSDLTTLLLASTSPVRPRKTVSIENILGEDLYQRLGADYGASTEDIRKAFKHNALRYHHDRSGQPDSRRLYEQLLEAYNTLTAPEKRAEYDRQLMADPNNFDSNLNRFRQHPLLKDQPDTYLNKKTFYDLKSVYDIPKDKLLVLDGYAFDVEEFESYVQSDLEKVYTNPHATSRGQNKEFSEAAKTKLRRHSTLGKYAKDLDQKLRLQKSGITNETIDKVIDVLNKFSSVDESSNALQEFLVYKLTLPEEEQKAIDNFIIEVPTIHGGFSRLLFKDAITGNDARCINIATVFGWQFVVTLRPEAMALVPEAAKKAARSMYLIITPSSDSNNQQHDGPFSNRQTNNLLTNNQPLSPWFGNRRLTFFQFQQLMKSAAASNEGLDARVGDSTRIHPPQKKRRV